MTAVDNPEFFVEREKKIFDGRMNGCNRDWDPRFLDGFCFSHSALTNRKKFASELTPPSFNVLVLASMHFFSNEDEREEEKKERRIT